MRTGRPRSFDRDEALERAIAVFWEHGYDATSIALLTGALGIGAPSLYAAFGDKRALFLEALDRYNRTYGAFTERALAEEPTARDAVERLLREAAAAYTRPECPRGCLLITAATNCSPQSADIVAQLRELRAVGARALEDKIAAAVRTESSPPTPTPMPSQPSTRPSCKACLPKLATAQRGPGWSRSPRRPSRPGRQPPARGLTALQVRARRRNKGPRSPGRYGPGIRERAGSALGPGGAVLV